jgi:hypothetical protein
MADEGDGVDTRDAHIAFAFFFGILGALWWQHVCPVAPTSCPIRIDHANFVLTVSFAVRFRFGPSTPKKRENQPIIFLPSPPPGLVILATCVTRLYDIRKHMLRRKKYGDDDTDSNRFGVLEGITTLGRGNPFSHSSIVPVVRARAKGKKRSRPSPGMRFESPQRPFILYALYCADDLVDETVHSTYAFMNRPSVSKNVFSTPDNPSPFNPTPYKP